MAMNTQDAQAFRKFATRWLEFRDKPEGSSWDRVCQNIELLYSRMSLPKPEIIPCRGPLQRIVFPSLVGAMLKQGQEDTLKKGFERTHIESAALRKSWQALWKEAVQSISWQRNLESEGTGLLLNKSIRFELERTLKSELTLQLDRAIGADLHSELEQLGMRILTQPYDRLRLRMLLDAAEETNLWNAFLCRLPLDMRGIVEAPVSVALDSVPYSRSGNNRTAWLGAWDWPWLATSNFIARSWSLELSGHASTHLGAWTELLRDAAAFLFCENCCFVYVKPTIVSFDENGRLHNELTAAVEFADGTKLFCWHGVEVPEFVITKPKSIKIKMIDEEPNSEVKRVMIERFGLDLYLFGAKVIHRDDFGVLYRKEMRGDEPLVVVKVTNSTPEPDGSFKNYFLRVPPQTTTAKAAVAWTFGLKTDEYNPIQES